MTTLFTNPPMWETHAIPDQPGKAYLRGGIRAGSRWPFTRSSPYLPDQFRFGSYLPTPFFLGSAAAYVEAAMPGSVVLRDSIARGESYQSFFTALARIKPDCLVLETGAAAWEHDLKLIKHIKAGYPQLRVAVAGPTVLTASKNTEAGWVDAWLVGEYEKNSLKFVHGQNGLISFDLLTRKEMNEIPYPMYDEEVALNYWDACPKGQKAPHMQLLTSRGCPYRCLSGDTPVNTVHGMIPIKDLVGRENVGVFTYDLATRDAKVSTATNILKVGSNEKLVRVHFDDGTHIDTTPDHKFLVFKASNQFVAHREWQVQAEDLKPGMRMRSMKIVTNGAYPVATWRRKGRAFVHRMVAEWKAARKLTEGEQVHHIDRNKMNYDPSNLVVMASAKEHVKEHPEIVERMKLNNPTKDGMSQEWIDKIKAKITGKKRSPEAKERYRLAAIKREAAKTPEQKKHGHDKMRSGWHPGIWSNKRRDEEGKFVDTNHRVVRVEHLDGLHDVYCLEVADTGWFFANGVLVKNCCFCAWPATMTGQDPDGTQPRAVRFHSPEWVEGSIRAFLSRHPGTKSIYFDDDTFNLADKHTLEMCKVMQRVKFPWTAMCRADTVTRDTWMTMRDSGCVGVKIGFESGSQRVVDEIVNKKLNLKEAAETAIWLRQIGLSVHGTFTIGLPGEKPEEVQMTHDFIADLYKRGALDTHQLSGTATIEGTPLDAISQGTSLKAYPGAKNDGSFVVNHDGVKKVEDMK